MRGWVECARLADWSDRHRRAAPRPHQLRARRAGRRARARDGDLATTPSRPRARASPAPASRSSTPAAMSGPPPVPGGGVGAQRRRRVHRSSPGRRVGLAETPVFLTSTMQVGRVYDAACRLLIERAAADRRRRRRHPGRGRVRRLLAQRRPPHAGAATTTSRRPSRQRGARSAAAALAPAEGAVGAGTGMSLLRLQGRHRVPRRGSLPDGHAVAVLADDELRRAGAARRSPACRWAAALVRRRTCTPPPAGSCIGVVVTDAPVDAAGCARLARADRPRAGPHRVDCATTAAVRSSSAWQRACAPIGGCRPTAAAIVRPRLDPYFEAVVEATEEAVLNATAGGTTTTGVGRQAPSRRPAARSSVGTLVGAAVTGIRRDELDPDVGRRPPGGDALPARPAAAAAVHPRGAALPQGRPDVVLRPEYARLRDELRVRRGRVDVRGTGVGSGRATDEYPEQSSATWPR